jgi:hypothetical protein
MHQTCLKLFASRKTLGMLEVLHGHVYVFVTEKGIMNVVSEGEVLKHTNISVTSM